MGRTHTFRNYRATILALAVVALSVPSRATTAHERFDGTDPVEEVVRALEQGRHWHATRLLQELQTTRRGPETSLLAARADAGRRAWHTVVERLGQARWLDSLALGAGRALRARAHLETGAYGQAIRDYRAYLDYSVERVPRGLAEVGLARALDAFGHGPDAAAAYGRAIELLPELEPWLAMRAAESLAVTGDTTTVRRWLSRATGLPSDRKTNALAEAFLQAVDREGAIRILTSRAGEVPPATAASLLTRAARVQLDTGDTASARATLRGVVERAPGAAREAADVLSDLGGLSADDYARLAHAYERSDLPARAAARYRDYVKAARPGTEERQRLELKMAALYFEARAYTAAIDALEGLLADGPSPAISARAEYLSARARYRRGERSAARQAFARVAERYPGSSSGARALWTLGDLYESRGQIAEARDLYSRLASEYAGSYRARRAGFRLGILAFHAGEFDAARQHFESCCGSRNDRLGVAADYWAARARLEEGGPNAEAEARDRFAAVHARDPFGYYGLLAAERADIDPWRRLPEGPEPVEVDAATRDRLARVDLLRRAGLQNEADALIAEVVDAGERSEAELLGLARALAERGHGGGAVKMGWRAHARSGGHWSRSVLRAIWPLAYPDILSAEAEARELDAHLLAAVVRQESAFAPDVISRAGARGLLQLMPRTAERWADLMGMSDYHDELLFHPETNVHLGAAFLADLQGRYDELQLALIAYNAGPSRARRWRQQPAYSLDPELFAERIPFTETQNYVKGVHQHLRIYRALYPEFGSETTRTD